MKQIDGGDTDLSQIQAREDLNKTVTKGTEIE